MPQRFIEPRKRKLSLWKSVHRGNFCQHSGCWLSLRCFVIISNRSSAAATRAQKYNALSVLTPEVQESSSREYKREVPGLFMNSALNAKGKEIRRGFQQLPWPNQSPWLPLPAASQVDSMSWKFVWKLGGLWQRSYLSSPPRLVVCEHTAPELWRELLHLAIDTIWAGCCPSNIPGLPFIKWKMSSWCLRIIFHFPPRPLTCLLQHI